PMGGPPGARDVTGPTRPGSPAEDPRTGAASLAEHGGRDAVEHRLIDRGRPFNDLTVAGNHLAGFDHHQVPRPKFRGQRELARDPPGFARPGEDTRDARGADQEVILPTGLGRPPRLAR